MSEIKFEVDNKEYCIKQADSKILSKAQNVYIQKFREACDSGAILKQSLEKHMRDQGLWDDKSQQKYEDLLKESADIEYRIKSKQYKKRSDLMKNALRLKEIREDVSELLSERNTLDSLTAEGQADQERFNFLLIHCVVDYKTQKPVFSSVDDYLEQAVSDLGRESAKKFAGFMYGLDDNFEDSLLENRLLKRLNALNDENQLVNTEGQRIDIEGNLLDEFGARVDKDGNRIDINNNPIIDDNIIDELEIEEDDVEEKKPATKPRARAKKKQVQPTE